jgi:hypothetical protein
MLTTRTFITSHRALTHDIASHILRLQCHLNGINMENKSKIGFASLTPERLYEISSKGGKARVEKLGKEKCLEISRNGGLVRSKQLGREGYAVMGRMGVRIRWNKPK